MMGAEARLRGFCLEQVPREGRHSSSRGPASPTLCQTVLRSRGAAAPGPLGKSRGLGRNRLWQRGRGPERRPTQQDREGALWGS